MLANTFAWEPLIDTIGKGWFFTLLAILSGIFGLIGNLSLRLWGMQWRKQRDRDIQQDNEVQDAKVERSKAT